MENKIKQWCELLATYGTLNSCWPEEKRFILIEIEKKINLISKMTRDVDNEDAKQIEILKKSWDEAYEIDNFFRREISFSDRDLFEGIVSTNVEINKSFKNLWIEFLEELFPKKERKFLLSLTVSGILFGFLIAWNFIFPVLNGLDYSIIPYVSFEQPSENSVEMVSAFLTGNLWESQ